MKISACMTLNDRPQEVVRRVFDSLRQQAHDELVIALDRTPPALADWCEVYWREDGRARFVELAGEPGWKSPVRAWNAAFEATSGDYLYVFSSEVIHEPYNVRNAVDLAARERAVVFGACTDDGPLPLVVSDRPNVLCDSRLPRPLGFIWAAPAADVHYLGGFDTSFADGYWYDDDDFFYRLWQRGLNFVFDDMVSGVHQHHARPVLETEAGQRGIQRNRGVMLQKWGMEHPLLFAPHLTIETPGRTKWLHVA